MFDSARRARPRLRTLALAAFALVPIFVASVAHAQLVQPWTPPGDSLLHVAVVAKGRFQRQLGDSTGGDNFDPYNLVGQLGRRMLAALGRDRSLQAQQIEATLDSLGLDTQAVIDPHQPGVVFLLVRNPFKRSSDAIGFLYWFRGVDLRMQGISFPPVRDFDMRVWYTGKQESPYEMCLLYQHMTGKPTLGMRLFRMEPQAHFWSMVQFENHGPEFGENTRGTFADVNQDGLPELLVWQTEQPDSFLTARSEVPPLVNEFLYTERPEGFVLHDYRTLPGPTQTLQLFAFMLVNHLPDRARRLLVKPAALDTALAIGWGKYAIHGAFQAEYGEADQAWPEWLEVKVRENAGWHRWIFHFEVVDGRWVIHDFIPVHKPSYAVPDVPTDTTRVKGP
ncbi:MAG TPA: hypothetical protein VMH61_05655 [Candidatus Acidoferrales bacterium]|nr:hypothetical protein [Candidatus Acidoferrales bacterium]